MATRFLLDANICWDHPGITGNPWTAYRQQRFLDRRSRQGSRTLGYSRFLRMGKERKAIGSYFAKFPDDRKKVFLVTKAASSNAQELSDKLNTSLQRMKTSYIDMYLIHYVSDVGKELTPEVRAWAERAKSEGTIRLFGFSAHKNMEASMLAAAKRGWIDGIMMSYNYRLMVEDEMKRAVDACARAAILQVNIDAALNKQRLSENDRQRLGHYARETAPGYCSGCAQICESAVDLDVRSAIYCAVPCTLTAMAVGTWR